MAAGSRYHSHPVFAPKPSQKDAENQRNYQALFRCEASAMEPFLGVIVGPYDVMLPTPVSILRPHSQQHHPAGQTPMQDGRSAGRCWKVPLSVPCRRPA